MENDAIQLKLFNHVLHGLKLVFCALIENWIGVGFGDRFQRLALIHQRCQFTPGVGVVCPASGFHAPARQLVWLMD